MREIIQSVCIIVAIAAIVGVGVWLAGSTNPTTPAGYMGYVTQGAVFGEARFLGIQTGPTSYGRTWMAKVVNVSVTPYTYDEPFDDTSAVLAKDSVKIRFAVHLIWKVKSERDQIKSFVEKFTTIHEDERADAVVKTAYDNFLKEPLRTSARNELQQFNALEIKDNIVQIGKVVDQQIRELCANTPFEVLSVVVGNIQYPTSVADAVANKMAATQRLEQVTTDAQTRIKEAEGIAKSMQIINDQLKPAYLQHEAIEAQKAMVGSPNHTTIYIPVGPMGVPIVGTVNVDGTSGTARSK